MYKFSYLTQKMEGILQTVYDFRLQKLLAQTLKKIKHNYNEK